MSIQDSQNMGQTHKNAPRSNIEEEKVYEANNSHQWSRNGMWNKSLSLLDPVPKENDL